MKKQKGSLTIFSTIVLLLVSAFVFALLEGTRHQELKRLAKLQTEVAMDAVLANYNHKLWETYHLLGTDYLNANEMVYKFSETQLAKKKTNFLRLKRESATVDNYTLITDGNGQAFINYVSDYMKEYMLYEALKEIYNQYEAIKSVLDSSQIDQTNIEKAIENIKSLEIEEKRSIGTSGTKKTDEKIASSVLETAQQWLEIGFLNLVIEDIGAVSEAEASFENGVLERKLQNGTNPVEGGCSIEDRILLQQYFCTYMSHYQEEKTDRILAYEVEYLLGGQERDIKNLEYVIHKLIVVREAANFLHLISSPSKSAKAEGIATLAVGASLNPLVIKAVKMGVLTAWALAESIVDVRAILAGKRVAFIKSEEYWATDLENLDEIASGEVVSKESVNGLVYEDYLRIFLLLEKEKTLAMRALQIQEISIQKNTTNPSFRIDTLLTQAGIRVNYSYESIFPFQGDWVGLQKWNHNIITEIEGGYY